MRTPGTLPGYPGGPVILGGAGQINTNNQIRHFEYGAGVAHTAGVWGPWSEVILPSSLTAPAVVFAPTPQLGGIELYEIRIDTAVATGAAVVQYGSTADQQFAPFLVLPGQSCSVRCFPVASGTIAPRVVAVINPSSRLRALARRSYLGVSTTVTSGTFPAYGPAGQIHAGLPEPCYALAIGKLNPAPWGVRLVDMLTGTIYGEIDTSTDMALRSTENFSMLAPLLNERIGTQPIVPPGVALGVQIATSAVGFTVSAPIVFVATQP